MDLASLKMNRVLWNSLLTSRNRYKIILVLAVSCVFFGVLFSPAFVSRVIKHGKELNAGVADKVIVYQFYLITAGALMICFSLYRLNKPLAPYLLPLSVIYVVLVYVVYIDEKYPSNRFLDPSAFHSSLNVFLGKELFLSDYEPRPSLTVHNRRVWKAKYPVIDTHFCFSSMKIDADRLVSAMDACGVAKVVNVDGAGNVIKEHISNFIYKYPDRFVTFAVLSLGKKLDDPDYLERELDEAVNLGAKGIKVYKSLGLQLRDKSGKLVPVNDLRLDPVWRKAGELGLPVLIHLGDPTPFFQPIDRFNERYQELRDFPNWSFFGPRFPRQEDLISQFENVLKKHPQTIFIGSHVLNLASDLASISNLMEKYPNLYVNFSARVNELGRQPYTARKFFLEHQDRILFSSDGGYYLDSKEWPPERFFRSYFEFLETENEYIEYPLWGLQKQGSWMVYGLNLPDDALEKIYYKNAAAILDLENDS